MPDHSLDEYCSRNDSIAIPPVSSRPEAFVDCLLRLLPRTGIVTRLVPSSALIADVNSDHGWWKEDSDAFFHIECAPVFPTDWVYLEGVLHRYSLSKARLHFTCDPHQKLLSSVVVPVTRRGYIREIVRIPPGATGMLWEPVDEIGFFSHQGLAISQITGLESFLRRLYRVVYDLGRFITVTERRDEAVRTLAQPLFRMKLQEAYQNTIRFRIFDSTPRSVAELWGAYRGKTPRQQSYAAADASNPPSLSVIVLHGIAAADATAETLASLPDQDLPITSQAVIPVDCTNVDDMSAAIRNAVSVTRTDLIVFIESGVRLEPQALARLVDRYRKDPAELTYADGVLIGASGAAEDLICRPAFSPELLRHHPYDAHLAMFERSFFEQNNRAAFTTDGSLNSLLVSCSSRLSSVAHVPEFLYTVAAAAQVRSADVQGNHQSDSSTRVAIIIPTHDAGDLLRQCIESLTGTIREVPFDIIIINHDSSHRSTLEYLDECSHHHSVLDYHGSFNFSRMNNQAVAQIRGPYSHYLFCNNDIEAIHQGWLETMMGFAQLSDVGIVGAELLYPDSMHIQHAGVCIGLHGLAEHYGKFLPVRMKTLGGLNHTARVALTFPHEVSAVTAACMLVRRDAFEAVRGFDEEMAIGFGDVDLCLRIRQLGYRCIYSPGSSLVHHESMTRGKEGGDPHPDDTSCFKKRWKDLIESGDPYYHPAFSRYTFTWQFNDPLPSVGNVRTRVWKKKLMGTDVC